MQILEFGSTPRKNALVIGEILRVHISDELLVDQEIQYSRLAAIGRLGAELYCRATEIFEMKRPYMFH